jgi:hypothetical protein
MPHEVPHFKDPEIEHGHFKVYPFTPGGHIIVDLRRKPGYRRVGKYIWKTAKEAGDVAKQWFEAGH